MMSKGNSSEDCERLQRQEYDDRVLLSIEDLENLDGVSQLIVESDNGSLVWVDVLNDGSQGSDAIDELLRIGNALIDAGREWTRDYYDLMNNVDPDGENR